MRLKNSLISHNLMVYKSQPLESTLSQFIICNLYLIRLILHYPMLRPVKWFLSFRFATSNVLKSDSETCSVSVMRVEMAHHSRRYIYLPSNLHILNIMFFLHSE